MWSASERGAVDLECHLGELLLGQLVGGDRLLEHDPLLGVGERLLEAGAGSADGAEDDAETGLVEARERPFERLRAGKHAVGRHANVVEHELGGDRGAERQLLVNLGSREPGRPLLDDEPADLAVLGSRPDDRDVGDRAVRDPHLGAVQDPVRPIAPRVRAHRAGIGARVRLRQPEAADHLARVHPRQPVLLLLLRAPAPDREHRERALHRDGAADARVTRLELEARQAIRDRARTGEAVAVQVHAEEAELRELRHHLSRQDALLEPVADLGQHLLADELPHRVPDRLLLVVEQRVDREEVEGVERGQGGS